jgi:hypothetical protein
VAQSVLPLKEVIAPGASGQLLCNRLNTLHAIPLGQPAHPAWLMAVNPVMSQVASLKNLNLNVRRAKIGQNEKGTNRHKFYITDSTTR